MKKSTPTGENPNPDEPLERAYEARIRVRNISGQKLSDCSVSTIAATAIVDGIDMYKEAGPVLLTERTEAVRQYFTTAAEHFVTHSERIIDEALNQLAVEANAMGTFALRSFGAPVHDARREVARELRERLDDGLRTRLKIPRGRPEGTARFINKHEFVADSSNDSSIIRS